MQKSSRYGRFFSDEIVNQKIHGGMIVATQMAIPHAPLKAAMRGTRQNKGDRMTELRKAYLVIAIPVLYALWSLAVRYLFEPPGSGGFALSMLTFFGGMILGVLIIIEMCVSIGNRMPHPERSIGGWFWGSYAFAIWTIVVVLIWLSRG